jgi:hypothetical protein
MSPKGIVGILMLVGLLLLLLPQAVPTQAQEPAPENDDNCVACHEHQYYVYDSGKWFCLCDAPMHCVYCHGGRTDSLIAEVAHEGLVLYPTRGHAERCQTCHSEDYMSRVVTFETVAGVGDTPIPLITATPVTLAATFGVEAPSNPLLLHLVQLETWRWVGLGVITIALVGIILFAYRCWKADCMARSKT